MPTSRVNDFVIKIATVNGTGSASANTLLMKSIFRSGIPVMGKNYFPSNIQGLPTWYEIRVSKDGYVARSGKIDIMVAMNAETYARDLRDVAPGGYLIYDSTWPRPALLRRDDITVIGIPLARMCNENFKGVRTRILMKNICNAGALAALLDLDLPGLDGLALARMLRAQGRGLPLLAVTARSDADAEAQARAAGFDDFLRKPVTGAMLAQALEVPQHPR